MFKSRFILVLGVLSLVLVTMAVSNPKSNVSPSVDQGASDFYQRHPGWTWAVPALAAIPVTSDAAFPDYYQRHPELSVSALLGVGASDYFQRHPELTAPAEASVDMTDYYFRQQVLFPAAKTIDLTDYYFRHR